MTLAAFYKPEEAGSLAGDGLKKLLGVKLAGCVSRFQFGQQIKFSAEAGVAAESEPATRTSAGKIRRGLKRPLRRDG